MIIFGRSRVDASDTMAKDACKLLRDEEIHVTAKQLVCFCFCFI